MSKLGLSLALVFILHYINKSNADLFNLCYTVQSNASSPFHPWSVAIQGVFNTTGAPFIPSPVRVSPAYGGNRTTSLGAGFTGTRTQIDQFGVTTTVNLTTCGADRSQLGFDQYLYEAAPYFDYHGMCLTVTNVSTDYWITLANNQPTDYMLLYTNLPSSTYMRELYSDWPVNSQAVVTRYNSSLPSPQCKPAVITDPQPEVTKWQFCYQSYGLDWQVAMSGVITTLATPINNVNQTTGNLTWHIISVTGHRVQNVSRQVTNQDIAGLGFSNSIDSPSSLDESDVLLFAQAPHISSSGVAFVSSAPFALANGHVPSQTTMQIPSVQLRASTSEPKIVSERYGPVPVWSQFAVSRLVDGYQCAMVSNSNSSNVATDSTLTPDEPTPTPANDANDIASVMMVMTMTMISMLDLFL